MAMIAANGTRLNVQRTERPGSPQILMCHGLAASMAFWMRHYVPALSPDCDLTLYDMRGHGRSKAPSHGYGVEMLTGDLLAVADDAGLAQPHVIAHSFGGVVALAAALRMPGRFASLTLLDSQIGLCRCDSAAPDPTLVAALAAAGADVSALKGRFSGLNLLTAIARLRVALGDADSGAEPGSDSAADHRVGFLMDLVHLSAARRWLKVVDGGPALYELSAGDGITRQGLSDLRLPLLLVYGETSPALSSGETIAAASEDAALEVISGGGHFFPLTRAECVIGACRSFWAGRDAQVSSAA